ncbi:MAG: (Fe-S)-binding protein [Pseudomonadota bacterium]
MSRETPFYEVSDSIVEAGGADLLKCYQCGTCTSACPWNLSASMQTRKMMHQAQLGLSGYEDDELWRCVTCLRCAELCPRGVGITDVVAAARSIMVEVGSVPRPVATALGSLKAGQNPWQGEKEQARSWMQKAGLERFREGHDAVLFPCCTNVYEPEARKASLDLAELLRRAGVAAGVLPSVSICCGDLAVRTGAGKVFSGLKEKLLQEFEGIGSTQAVVTSPHCLVTLARSVAPAARVVHYVQVLARHLEEGKLNIRTKLQARVTYHDPCYLGRWSGVYEPPRSVLKAVAGDNLVEMARNRSMAVCCGGGGGGVFSEVPKEERLGVLRVGHALETGAEIIATACPYCMAMLSDGILAAGAEDRLVVKDIAQLLLEAIS